MKKNLLRNAIYLMVMSIAVGFSACSDKDDDASFIVNDGEDDISINRMGGTIDIPITATGDWKATVTTGADETHWAGVKSAEGSGSGTLQVIVDYFSPKSEKQERTASIELVNGGKKQVISLRQYIGLKEDETAENASTQPFTDLWKGKGIGSGLDITTGEQTENMVLNAAGLIELSRQTKYSTLFRQTTNPNAKNEVQLIDTLENNTKGLAVDCELDVKYAKFKLNIQVHYNNTGQQLNHVATYNGTQQLVFLSAATDLTSIAGILRSRIRNLEEDKEDPIIDGIVTQGFQFAYKDIMAAYNSNDETGFNECVKEMLDNYGPAVVTGADLGGSLFVSMRYDSLYVANKFGVGGTLSLGLALAAININADVNVQYSDTGYDIWRNSHHYIVASGGDKAALVALTNLMADLQPNREKIKTAAVAWANSIVSSDNEKDNTVMVRMRYTPIWNLFPYKVAGKIKKIAVDYYNGKRVCVHLKDLEVLKDSVKSL